MIRKKVLYGVIPSVIFLFLIGGVIYSPLGISITDSSNQPATNNYEGIGYEGSVCVTHSRDGEVLSSECDHNVLFNTGADMVKDTLIAPSGAADYIELCNATITGAGCGIPVVAKTEAYVVYADCGLAVGQGDNIDVLGQVGNWTIAKTFTATCDNLLVNATRLQNSTGADLAGNTFTLVTLQTNDQLTINWTLQVA